MKRLVSLWVCCTILTLGSFGVLLVEDRRLGVPLPYSIALAFVTIVMMPAAPMVFSRRVRVLSRRLMAARRSRVPVAEPVAQHTALVQPRRAAEGVVLLELPKPASARGHAA